MRYHYAEQIKNQIAEIQGSLPLIPGNHELPVSQRAIPEFNAYTGEWFMSWFIDEDTNRLFLYYPSIGNWQVKYDVTAESWLANGVHVGRDVEPANTIPRREGYGPLTDVISQANQKQVTH